MFKWYRDLNRWLDKIDARAKKKKFRRLRAKLSKKPIWIPVSSEQRHLTKDVESGSVTGMNTVILYRNRLSGELKTEKITGHWTLKEIRGMV